MPGNQDGVTKGTAHESAAHRSGGRLTADPSEAVAHGSLGPVHAYLSHWAALIEIERHPETAKAYHRAEYLAHIAAEPAKAREHLTTASHIYRAAAEAVRAE